MAIRAALCRGSASAITEYITEDETIATMVCAVIGNDRDDTAERYGNAVAQAPRIPRSRKGGGN